MPKTSVRGAGGKQVRKVSARASAEATLCEPSTTSHGFSPITSTRAGQRSDLNPRSTSDSAHDQPLTREDVERRQRDGRVPRLVRPEQGQLDRPQSVDQVRTDTRPGRGAVERGRGALYSQVKSRPISWRRLLRSRAARRITARGLVAGLAADRGTPALDDPGLLAGDRRQGRAELLVWSNEMLVMTETAGRTTFVESSRPPHADLQHDGPGPASGEVEQAHRGRDLEEGRAPVAVGVVRQVQFGDGKAAPGRSARPGRRGSRQPRRR